MSNKCCLQSIKLATDLLLNKNDRCPGFRKATRTWLWVPRGLLSLSETLKRDTIRKKGTV